jgi:hypothetical protein
MPTFLISDHGSRLDHPVFAPMIALGLVLATRTGALSAALRCSTMLRITLYATLIVILVTGAASAQYDPWRTQHQKNNDEDIDRAYQSTIERLPNPKKEKSDPWADPQLTPSGAATTPSAAAKQNGRYSGTPRPAKD